MKTSIRVAFLCCSLLIIAAARGDLWLDEIWSIFFARRAQSPADIFLQFHHDNNHVLNTLYLYLLRGQKNLYLYRLLAIVSGIGSTFLIHQIAERTWDKEEALVGIVLTGASYPLILYFSEARGYGLAIFFALLSYALLQSNNGTLKTGTVVLFWLVSVLGILSHATFIMVIVALSAASVVHELRATNSVRLTIARVLFYHGPPLGFIALWYLFFIKGMEIGGGPVSSRWEVITQASALLIGLPDFLPYRSVGILIVLAITALGTVKLYQEDHGYWLFFPMILLVSPATILIVNQSQFLAFRYLILCFPFFYLLLAHLICSYSRLTTSRIRWVPIGFLALSIVGQAEGVYGLLTKGRGQYSSALSYLSAMVPSDGTLSIGSDHDFRNGMMVAFYRPLIPNGNKLRYLPRQQWYQSPPDWIITHSQARLFHPAPSISIPGVGSYQLIRDFPFSGISGWRWFLYRREVPHLQYLPDE